MFKLSQDIQSLTDFKRNTPQFLKRLKESASPLILTVNGRAAVIVQDPESYELLLERADRFEAISAVDEAMVQSSRQEGEMRERFDRAMRKKNEIPR